MDSITFLQNLIDLKRKLAQKVELWAKGGHEEVNIHNVEIPQEQMKMGTLDY
jgi:hypothetical protein